MTAFRRGCFVALLLAMTGRSVFGVPAFESVKGGALKSDVWLKDRNNRVIHETRADARTRRLEWVGLADISPALREAVIVAEDKRFFSHGGVDYRALLSAMTRRLFGGAARGASTIPMQVASLLDPSLNNRRGRRSPWKKWRQMSEGRALVKAWTREQILETYLNLVSFRGELVGVAAAARGLFHKEPHGLDRLESVLLASLLRAPNSNVAMVADRACRLGKRLEKEFSCDGLADQAKQVLSVPYAITPKIALAPHVARQLLRSRKGDAPLVTTLDGTLQRVVLQSLDRQLSELRAQNVQEGAALVVDNGSGEVLAYVGNTSGSKYRYVDGVQAFRQAGSTLKPFLYGLAIERKILTGVSLLDDSPYSWANDRGVYQPGNYDNRYRGIVTAREALASSLNIPAVRVLELVGENAFGERLRLVGFEGLEGGEFYGPSLALGTADVRLWDLVNAYRTLARAGVWSPLRLEPGLAPKEDRPIYSAEAAYLISDILSDRESRSLTFGLENPLATRFWTAVKTGTSKDMRDNWCVGYSGRYTVGVWVGNFAGDPMWNVSGTSGAAPVWIEVMNFLHRDNPSIRPARPSSLQVRTVRLPSGAAREEVFLAGTEMTNVVRAPKGSQPRIRQPQNKMIVALDPDIPRDRQRIAFESDGGEGGWEIDGKQLEWGAQAIWNPRMGRHRVALKNHAGDELDAVDFEVRGSWGGE